MTIEKAAYKVILEEGDFEIRHYEPMIVAVSKEDDFRGGAGFDKLFSYISGNNSENEKIKMTSPVFNDLNPENLTIAFKMPEVYTFESLPKPNESGVQLKEILGRQVAVIKFSGNIDQAKIDEKKNELLRWLNEKKIISRGLFELARYNPPFIPGFIKHNELLIEVYLDV